METAGCPLQAEYLVRRTKARYQCPRAGALVSRVSARVFPRTRKAPAGLSCSWHYPIISHLSYRRTSEQQQQWILFLAKEVSAIIRCPAIPSIYSSKELLNLLNAFHQGDYQTVIDADNASFSNSNAIQLRVLQLRSRIASGSAKEVLADIAHEKLDVPDFAAVKALALQATGNTSEALREAERLASTSAENATVQILGGTVLQAAGETEEALALLAKHQGNLEAYEASAYRKALILMLRHPLQHSPNNPNPPPPKPHRPRP